MIKWNASMKSIPRSRRHRTCHKWRYRRDLTEAMAMIEEMQLPWPGGTAMKEIAKNNPVVNHVLRSHYGTAQSKVGRCNVANQVRSSPVGIRRRWTSVCVQ